MPLPSGWLKRGTLVRTFLSTILMSVAIAQGVGAQVADPSSRVVRHSLGLEAHSVANGGKTQLSGGAGGTGSVPAVDTVTVQFVGDRRVSSNRTNIEINVRNFGTVPDRVRVEWFFVAMPVGTSTAGNHEVIFHRDAQTLAIPGGKTATQIVSSPEVRALYERSTTVTNIPASQSANGLNTSLVAVTNLQKGLSIRGWMVRLVSEDDRVLAAKGSSQTYEEIASNPSRLAGLLAFSGLPGTSTPANGSGESR